MDSKRLYFESQAARERSYRSLCAFICSLESSVASASVLPQSSSSDPVWTDAVFEPVKTTLPPDSRNRGKNSLVMRA